MEVRGTEDIVSGYLGLDLLGRMVGILREAESRARSLAEPLQGSPLEDTAYVDGSYVLDERRGICLAVFSSASLRVRSSTISEGMRGSREPTVHIIIPKSYSESRASILMSILEMLTAMQMIEDGVQAVFLDGSYVSSLLASFGFAQELFSRVQKEVTLQARDVLEDEGAGLQEGLRAATRGGGVRPAFKAALKLLIETSGRLYSALCDLLNVPESRKDLLDYCVAYTEETAYLTVLAELVRMAGSRGAALYWIAKDSESRFLTEREGVLGWLNDLLLLDYAWRDLGDVYMKMPGLRFGMPKGLVAFPGAVEEVFRDWSETTVVYYKVGARGVVTQLTYPSRLSEGLVADALATLRSLADKRYGYPRPMNYVHNMAVLNPGLARLLADEYHRRGSPMARFLFAPSGRRMLGLS